MPQPTAHARNPRRLAGRGVFVSWLKGSVRTTAMGPCRGWHRKPVGGSSSPCRVKGPVRERAHLPVSATGSLCRECGDTVKRKRETAIQQPFGVKIAAHVPTGVF